MVPADLLANERARIRRRLDDQDDATSKQNVKHEERRISIAAWQARWNRSERARWTHRLLPNVSRWLSRPPFDMTIHLTQVPSGHGCFRNYLSKINRSDDSYCSYCMDPNDTAEHTVFMCPRWEDDRARMTEILRRPPNAGDVEDILCGPCLNDLPGDVTIRNRLLVQAKKTRDHLVEIIESIMSTKKEDEREEGAAYQGTVRR